MDDGAHRRRSEVSSSSPSLSPKRGNAGTVEWDEFQKFFEKCKNPEEMRALLSAQNAKYLDYKMMVEGDPNFGKRFFVPPSKSKKFKFSV